MPPAVLPRRHPTVDGQLAMTLPGVRLRLVTGPTAAPPAAPAEPEPARPKPDRSRKPGRRGKPRQDAGAGPGRSSVRETRVGGRGRGPRDNRPASKPTGPPRTRAPKQPTRLQPAAESLAPPTLPPGVSLPRRWTLEFEALDGAEQGKVRISVTGARGEHRVFRPNPDLIWQAVFWARFTTAAAGVAAWQGRRTVMDALTEHDDPTEEKRRRLPDADELAAKKVKTSKRVSYGADRDIRPDQANPALYTPNPPEPDGTRTWSGPYKGRRTKKLPAGVERARLRMGLPMSWEEHCAMNGLEAEAL